MRLTRAKVTGDEQPGRLRSLLRLLFCGLQLRPKAIFNRRLFAPERPHRVPVRHAGT